MLRVWKPSSPMNLGSWTLTVYTLLGGIAALRELLRVSPQRRAADRTCEEWWTRWPA